MHRNILVAITFLLAASQAGAQALEHTLVTGTYAPLAELTASVSVIEQTDIQKLNKRSIAEILQTIPGLLVERQGGPGGLTAVSIRGAESNFTLVLLDGVPVNDPTNTRGGGFDFANLNPSLVERIEVIRGSQSAIYGSDALAGVINILTRQPTAGHSADLGAELGEDGFENYTVGARGAGNSWDYSIGFASRDDGEPVPGSTRDSDNANLRLGWNPAPGHRLEFGYRYLNGQRSSYPEQSGGPEYAVSNALDSSEYRDQVFALAWKAQLNKAWQSSVTMDRFSHEDDYASPGISPYLEVPPNGADSDFQQDRLRWVNTLSVTNGIELNLGADYRDEEAESDGYLEYFGVLLPADFALQRNTAGLFANVTTPTNKIWLLQGTARYDDPDGYDAQTTVSLGARYRLSDTVSASANWGEAFKLPSFSALGNPLVGDPELRPETASNWDIGLAWSVNTELRMAATGFFNDFENLVDFDSETFRNVNRKNVKTSGVELEFGWQVKPQLRVRGQLTYTDIEVKGEDSILTGRPEWVASATANWQFAERWHTVLDYRYSGEQWSTSRYAGSEESRLLDAFHRLDWSLQWSVVPQWQLRLTVDNLLNEDYQNSIGFPAPGRSIRFGLYYGV
jgi:vitamin B12 transporter